MGVAGRGRVLTPYSNDNAQPYAGGMHRGIDIAAASGAGVVAARAGHGDARGRRGLVRPHGRGAHGGRAPRDELSAPLRGRGEEGRRGRGGRAGSARSARAADARWRSRTCISASASPTREDHYVDPLSLLPALAAPAGAGSAARSGAGAGARRAEPAPVPVAVPRARAPEAVRRRAAPARVPPAGHGAARARRWRRGRSRRLRRANPARAPTRSACPPARRPARSPAVAPAPLPAAGRVASPARHAGPGADSCSAGSA